MVYLASSFIKKNIVFPVRSRFQVKLVCWVPFDQHLVLVACVNLSLSLHNIFWNMYSLATNPLCNHLYTQLRFVKLYHIFFKSVFTGWSKNFFSINRNIVIFYFYSCKKISYVSCSNSSIFKWKDKESIYCLKNTIN